MDTQTETPVVAEYTTKAITAIATKYGFEVKPPADGTTQGWQLRFPNDMLGTISDTEKIKKLNQVVDAFQAAGYNCEAQLSHQDKSKTRWLPYPCAWVNKQARTRRGEAEKAAVQVAKKAVGTLSVVTDMLGKLAAKAGIDVSEEMNAIKGQVDELSQELGDDGTDGPVEQSQDQKSGDDDIPF